MQAYQFIKYNNKTNIEHLRKYAKNNAVLCFDFEDSIIISEKEIYREYFKRHIANMLSMLPTVKVCVRINNESVETEKDLEALANLHLNSIMLPKIESIEEILKLEELFAKKNISYDEIIPIIESKKGLQNLEFMAETPNPKIKRYAFGHCDYNLSINAFPFFHQNSNN